MSHWKTRLKAFVLLGLVALGVAGIQAESGQALTWDVNGKEITSTVSFDGTHEGEMRLLVPGLSLVVSCKEISVENGVLLAGSSAHLSLAYSGCKATLWGMDLSATCLPLVLSTDLKILPILHNTKIYLLMEPLTVGQPFMYIYYDGAFCPLAEEIKVKGSTVLECLTEFLLASDCKVSRLFHRAGLAPQALFPEDELKYGVLQAFVHDELGLFLTGIDADRIFNALV